jgi:hypothetical protein
LEKNALAAECLARRNDFERREVGVEVVKRVTRLQRAPDLFQQIHVRGRIHAASLEIVLTLTP